MLIITISVYTNEWFIINVITVPHKLSKCFIIPIHRFHYHRRHTLNTINSLNLLKIKRVSPLKRNYFNQRASDVGNCSAASCHGAMI